MSKPIALTLLLFVCGSTTGLAFAADEMTGFRAGFGGGQVTYTLDSAGVSEKDSSPAFEVMGGYALNQYFAGELSYAHIGTQGIDSVAVKSDALELSAVGTWPFLTRYGVYARAGFLRWSLDSAGTSDSGNNFTYGVGAQAVIDRALVRLEYDRWSLNDVEAKFINLGFCWTF
jgi:OmpA-OmpF porin, OOP family